MIKRRSMKGGRMSARGSSAVKLPKLSVDQINFKNKRVLMRVDFNVPMKEGKIENCHKIVVSCPTIRFMLERGAKQVILISHLGQPDGRVVSSLTLKPVASELQAILGRQVGFINDCVGPRVESICLNLEPGSIVILENLRFHLEEEGKEKTFLSNKSKADAKGLEAFCSSLTRLADVFVNDAFGASNKCYSSMVGINIPLKVSGFHLKRELAIFNKIVDIPSRPYIAIIGGGQILEKIKLIDKLIGRADDVILGANVAIHFCKALHKMEIGKTNFNPAAVDALFEIHTKIKTSGVSLRVHYPQDYVIGNVISSEAEIKIAHPANGIPKELMALDIGPKSTHEYAQVIETARTILWNGPMGEVETDLFANGTKSVMESVVKVTQKGALSIIVGTRTANCAKMFNTLNKISHTSTGGRASLDYIQGKPLPGVDVLSTMS